MNSSDAIAKLMMEVMLVADGPSSEEYATGRFMRPAYEATIGSESFSLENEPELVSVQVARNMGLPTDSCEVCIIGGKDYFFNKGDNISVHLGYDDIVKPVFSGLVESINYELNKVKVVALGIAVRLLLLRLNRVYLNQTAGKIVTNIAEEANIRVKVASEGINFPSYVIDNTANAYEHILKIAERCNFDAYFTEDEQLMFKEWEESQNHILRCGQEVIRITAFDFSPIYTSAQVYGESPSSVKGSDTYHWLTKREVKGEAGEGQVLSIHDPAIRDKKTAETVARSKMERLRYTFGLAVETVGKPQIKLGDTITLENVPNSTLTGQLEVRGFEHHLSKDKGFTTIINCWKRSE